MLSLLQPFFLIIGLCWKDANNDIAARSRSHKQILELHLMFHKLRTATRGQSYKQFTLVIYDSRVVIWGIFQSGTTLEL